LNIQPLQKHIYKGIASLSIYVQQKLMVVYRRLWLGVP